MIRNGINFALMSFLKREEKKFCEQNTVSLAQFNSKAEYCIKGT